MTLLISNILHNVQCPKTTKEIEKEWKKSEQDEMKEDHQIELKEGHEQDEEYDESEFICHICLRYEE